ncbi:phage head-tail joining protein [Citreimonas sp.]|uniref:phage head-tail joining protein n=1 Tax=Citreimonas sp. TaxID=3036715 RepID=UPI00405A33B6
MSGYTQAQLDALREAAARGVRSVSYDGQTVQYSSVDDMLKMIARIERSLGTKKGPQINTYKTDRGFR